MTARTADVVVIGAGVLGAATAYYLAAHGRRVVVLERGAANREGSGTTAGNLHIQAVHTRRPGQAVALDSRRFLPLQKAASQLWDDVSADIDADIELTRTGGFTVAETQAEHDELMTKAVWEAEAGIATEVLDGATARSALPALAPSVRAVTWCPVDGYANPLLVGPAYLAAAARLGTEIRTGQAVDGLERHRDLWTVRAGGVEVQAPVVVNVAGPWIAPVCALADVRLAMAPVSIQMHATVRTPPVLPNLVQHIGAGLSVKQVRAGNLLIGGGWPSAPMRTSGRTPTSVASLAGNLALAIRILPMLSRLRLLRMWAGPLAATPDEMPVIGEIDSAPGLFVAGGTYAFTFAPLWAQTLCALIHGRAPLVDLTGLGPNRLVQSGEPT
jgi:sarcosine oxidase, subunit beta